MGDRPRLLFLPKFLLRRRRESEKTVSTCHLGVSSLTDTGLCRLTTRTDRPMFTFPNLCWVVFPSVGDGGRNASHRQGDDTAVVWSLCQWTFVHDSWATPTTPWYGPVSGRESLACESSSGTCGSQDLGHPTSSKPPYPPLRRLRLRVSLTLFSDPWTTHLPLTSTSLFSSGLVILGVFGASRQTGVRTPDTFGSFVVSTLCPRLHEVLGREGRSESILFGRKGKDDLFTDGLISAADRRKGRRSIPVYWFKTDYSTPIFTTYVEGLVKIKRNVFRRTGG